VGDQLETDAHAARSAGWVSVWLNRAPTTLTTAGARLTGQLQKERLTSCPASATVADIAVIHTLTELLGYVSSYGPMVSIGP
jgi:FMN phosphatase YigB (HAD superfamily)